MLSLSNKRAMHTNWIPDNQIGLIVHSRINHCVNYLIINFIHHLSKPSYSFWIIHHRINRYSLISQRHPLLKTFPFINLLPLNTLDKLPMHLSTNIRIPPSVSYSVIIDRLLIISKYFHSLLNVHVNGWVYNVRDYG